MNAIITGVGCYVPERVLTNEDLSQMVDTSDEWIMSRIGIKQRHILDDGIGASYMAIRAVKQLLVKTNVDPSSVDLLMVATSTPDYPLPSTASIVCENLNITNAFAFDVEAACCGFLYLLEISSVFIKSNRYKRIVIVGVDKMSSIVDYKNRNICPIFGDGAGAFMIEPGNENGIIDSFLRTDGTGFPFLHVKYGGSAYPKVIKDYDDSMFFLHQDGKTVFKHAVSNMVTSCKELMSRNNLCTDDIDWIIPHQANYRIIESVANNLSISLEKVLVNIKDYGNTSAASLPLCIGSFENKIKAGDSLIFTAFGAGFSWGAIYIKWAYNSPYEISH